MIPKVIHYCWFGGKPLPALAKKCLKSWAKYLPEYQIVEWNERNYNLSKNAYMFAAYQAGKWGFVPDYARLDIVYEHGGIYFDTDVEVLRSFDCLLESSAFCGFESRGAVNFGQGFGAEKHSEIIGQLRDAYLTRSFRLADGTLNLTPSPVLQTEDLASLGLVKNGELQKLNGITVYPVVYFSPLTAADDAVPFDEAYSIHHFMGSWLPWYLRWKMRISKMLKMKYPLIHSKIKKIFSRASQV